MCVDHGHMFYYHAGRSDIPGMPAYALYHHVLDCFVGITTSEIHAQRAQWLLSSQYPIFPVLLTTADNWTSLEIDHSNCELYTLHDKDLINPSRAYTGSLAVCRHIDVADAGPLQIRMTEKHKVMFYLYCLQQLQNQEQDRFSFVESDAVLSQIINEPQLKYVHEFDLNTRKRLWWILYRGRDLAQTMADLKRWGFAWLIPE
jgi:hypothetical protein